MNISRDQVVNRLREARFKHKGHTRKVEILRQQGTGQRIDLAHRKLLPEKYVRIVLSQAGLSSEEIDDFIASAVKS